MITDMPSDMPSPRPIGPSPTPSDDAATPPPSLASTGTSSKSYTLNLLLALATPKAQLPSPALARINSFSEIRRDSISDWGVDESSSTILDGEPISKSLPIPNHKLVGEEGNGHPADMLFNYQSTPGDMALPILIDFTHKDPFGQQPICKGSASSVFHGVPGSAGDASRENVANSLGDRFSTLRMGNRTPSFSRSTSPALSDGSSRTRSDSVSSLTGSLNPFAAPWPLPQTTPKLITTNTRSSSIDSSTNDEMMPSLPLPKLPSSLPKRPNVVLPPVFVKRESAALPQSMTLPDIAPLGPDWDGDKGLSGNERRRRASETPPSLPNPRTTGVMRLGESLGNQPRPERLIKLGQKLRESASAQSGSKSAGGGVRVKA